MYEKYLEKLVSRLPELCSTKDLVSIGFYASSGAASNARRLGKCPEYVKLPQRGIVYLREAVIDFILESQKKKSCTISKLPKEEIDLAIYRKDACLKASSDHCVVEKSDSYTDAV